MESIARRLSRRWNTLRTDLRWIGNDLRGRPRPFVIERAPGSRYRDAPRPPGLAARPLRVTAVSRETADTLTFTLEQPDGSPFGFEAGQFLSFQLQVGGEVLRRAYSLSSSPLDAERATITVKRVPDGRASRWLHRNAAAGMTLRALGPSGSFVAADVPEHAMVAGGAGITPIISIAETVLRSRPQARVHLLYGSRTEADIIFRERLDKLADEHPNLSITYALERAPDGFGGVVGRVDPAAVEGWLEPLDRSAGDTTSRAYYICGPAGMMDATRAVLDRRGVAPEQIHEERFASPGDGSSAELPDRAVTARLRADGTDHIVSVPPGKTLLESGLAAGVKMPFSCAMGGCAACRCRLVDGEVVMDEPNCLTDEERSDGYILACVSRPLGSIKVEVP